MIPNADIRLIVGLEIHVQLQTATKMFCACPVRYEAPPNSCVCPVCLGHPGTLPVINRQAVEFSVRTGLALGCRIARRSKWDRKSYYYPDMPKNYQISQYDLPLAEHGRMEIDVDGGSRTVRIKRAHLEEDAGKNIHDAGDCTLVDLNRAGTPLLEIVTEPDITSPEEAYAFCVELQRLVRHLGVSEGIMQRGQMRFEPNVNVVIEKDGKEFRTPIVEIKNLNSFRSVRNAIHYEMERHIAAWRDDPDFVLGVAPNENRGWNDDRGVTEYQRPKEAAHDYRYFPDPDLVPVTFDEAALHDMMAALPERSVARRRRLVAEFGLDPKDADTIVDHRPTADLFESAVSAGAPAALLGKQFVNVWLRLANDRNVPVTELGVSAASLAELARIVEEGTISRTAANQVAEAMLEHGESPSRLAESMGLVQVRDASAAQAWVDQAFAENDAAIRDALENPKKATRAVAFLRGQVMKLSQGKADPRQIGEMIERRLEQMR
ncbi:MAG: Asp-tRNA(Asn)/Glu-tRNA(Gln) amidotransferase subunit GatB [Phycisphaerae bacterium]|nr:Asp-tRNA(Asn)/Glu-tRNA(Gln) amidotransferase subunit GatB [Phycisphaerae bacterium]